MSRLMSYMEQLSMLSCICKYLFCIHAFKLFTELLSLCMKLGGKGQGWEPNQTKPDVTRLTGHVICLHVLAAHDLHSQKTICGGQTSLLCTPWLTTE